MTKILLPDGSLEIPEEFRKADALEAGQRFEIERIGQGEYHVRAGLAVPPVRDSLIALLQSCPVKDFFVPLDRCETTDDLKPMSFE